MSDISAIMLTHNCTINPGRDVFENALRSLECFPEIIAVDGGSTDDTIKILKDYNAKVFNRPNIGPDNPIPRQNNYALRQISNDFSFSLDSDETINPKIYDILKERHQEAWFCWIPRVTMKNATEYFTEFVPDPQGRFLRPGYAFWLDDGVENLHQLPYIVNGNENNQRIHTENEFTIIHWGYVLSESNIPNIRAKYAWHTKLQSKAERNIFKNAEKAGLDPIDYLNKAPVDIMRFK